MIEDFISYICSHAHQAHWIIFIGLLLGGLSIPISADILILSGGAIASTCIPDHTARMYAWILFGFYGAAWEAYWIGRELGPRLFKFRLFRHFLTPQRVEKLRKYYANYGLLTFIIGRFCPGGVRNALFMSSGLTRMPFHIFIFRDSIAAALSSATLFFIGYKFGENLPIVLHYFHRYTEWFVATLTLVLVSLFSYFWYRHKQRVKEKENS